MRSEEVVQLRRLVDAWNKQEKAKAVLTKARPDQYASAKTSEVWEGNLQGEQVKRLIVYLRSSGCQFALNTGGCTMCAHALQETTFGLPISAQDYLQQFRIEYERRGLEQFPIVCVYNEGNMLFEGELPGEALRAILEIIRDYGVARRVILESRTEYITSRTLDVIRGVLPSAIEVEMGIGLESVNDFVRNVILQKAMTLSSYERAVALLKEYDCFSLAYILVKPPFLNEAQAFSEAVATGIYAFRAGTDVISLEPTGVEDYTIVQRLYEWKKFTPSSLWTVIETTKALSALGEVRIGGQQFAPIPHTRSRTCEDEACIEIVLAAIRQYNLTHDLRVLDSLTHICKPLWARKISNEFSVIDEEQLAGAVQKALLRARVTVSFRERFLDLLGM